jgi:arginine deiminase|tara:strand:- start:768 stop:1082 length:315 start_codon:yes stop_codon:yes gene_type:complete
MEVGEFRKEHEAFERRIKEWVETKTSFLEGKLNEANEVIIQNKQQFQDELVENQKETLWKIRDVENLMEKRISEHKVNTLLDAMDKKFKNLIKDTDDQQTKTNL